MVYVFMLYMVVSWVYVYMCTCVHGVYGMSVHGVCMYGTWCTWCIHDEHGIIGIHISWCSCVHVYMVYMEYVCNVHGIMGVHGVFMMFYECYLSTLYCTFVPISLLFIHFCALLPFTYHFSRSNHY